MLALQKFRFVTPNSPVSLMKCVKNAAEVKGMKAANVRDAVALCRYFHWMEQEVRFYLT